MQNQIEGITALMDLRSCTDSITFDVKGVEGQVRVVGSYEVPWFNGRDVCAVLQYKNPLDSLQKHVLPHQKKSLSLLSSELGSTRPPNLLGANNLQNLSYHDGKAVYINGSGFKTLIKKCAKIDPLSAEAIAEHPFIKQFVNYEVITIRKEHENISCIKETFYYMTCKSQFTVGSYYVDLYIKDYNLAIECDEFGHSGRDPLYEEERQKYIEDRLGCHFIRFNPDEYKFSIFRVIGDIHRYMLTKTHQCMNVLSCELEHLKL